VFLLLYLSTRTNQTQGERPKRAAPPTRKLIENTQATAANDPGDYSSIIRDADAIFAAVQAVSFSEPRTAAIAFKAPEVDPGIAERAGGDWEKTGKEAKWTHSMLQYITAPQSTLQTQPTHMNIANNCNAGSQCRFSHQPHADA
jgi:hypothetical protein